MRYAAIIPARGNSKGIPNKNLRLVNGKPLIVYQIELALECCDYVFVSSEDKQRNVPKILIFLIWQSLNRALQLEISTTGTEFY